MYNSQKNLKSIPSHTSEIIYEKIIKDDIFKHNHKRVEKETIQTIHDIIAILLTRKYNNNSYNYVLIPQSPNTYSKILPQYNLKSIKKAIKILIELNIIEKDKYSGNIQLKKKYPEPKKYKYETYSPGITSRYYLNDFYKWRIKLTLDTIAKFFPEKKYKHNCIIRDKKNREEYQLNDKDINYINSYLDKRKLSEFKYQRIFQDKTDNCGRLYNFFQRIKKEDRKIIYEHNNLTEIDFHAMAPNILYMLKTGQKYSGDVYGDVLKDLGLSSIYRDIIKKAFLIILNTHSKIQAEKAIIKYFNENFNFNIIISPYILFNSIEKIHSKIKSYFYHSNYRFLQNIESKIIIKILLFLIKLDLVPLSIHDCIVIPKEQEIKLKESIEYIFINFFYKLDTIDNLYILKFLKISDFVIFNNTIMKNKKKNGKEFFR